MISTIKENLNKGVKLLELISNEQYSDDTIPPYFSSIGCHIRHILDVFSCVFKGLENKSINLTERERNKEAEEKRLIGINYFHEIIDKLNLLKEEDLDTEIQVSDDLGSGLETATYSLKAVLMQAQSHTIHHYATIGFLIHHLGIDLPYSDFGYNPTTPKKISR